MVRKLMMAAALSATVALSMTAPAFADKDNSATKADNTKMNQEMRANQEMTADQQGQSKADLKMSQDIRRAVVKDKALSQYAHNVKIITRDGKVTLKGPVKSEKEKHAVGKIAARVAGSDRVTNELEVASPKSK